MQLQTEGSKSASEESFSEASSEEAMAECGSAKALKSEPNASTREDFSGVMSAALAPSNATQGNATYWNGMEWGAVQCPAMYCNGMEWGATQCTAMYLM